MLPCPSLSSGVCSDLCPFSWWCYTTISSSISPFSSMVVMCNWYSCYLRIQLKWYSLQIMNQTFSSPSQGIVIVRYSLLQQKYGMRFCHVNSSESESHSIVSDSLWSHGLYGPWDSPGQNTEVGSRSLLQGIFPIQGSESGLPHCRRSLYQLSQRGSPLRALTSLPGINCVPLGHGQVPQSLDVSVSLLTKCSEGPSFPFLTIEVIGNKEPYPCLSCSFQTKNSHQHFRVSFDCLWFWFYWPSCVACGILVPPEIELVALAMETWSPNHWTTRNSSGLVFKSKNILNSLKVLCGIILFCYTLGKYNSW